MNWIKNPGRYPEATGPMLVMFNDGEVIFDETGASSASWATGGEDWHISHYLLLPPTPEPVSWLVKAVDGKAYARFTGRGKEAGRIAVLAHLYSDVYLLYAGSSTTQTMTLQGAGECLEESDWVLDSVAAYAGEAT